MISECIKSTQKKNPNLEPVKVVLPLKQQMLRQSYPYLIAAALHLSEELNYIPPPPNSKA